MKFLLSFLIFTLSLIFICTGSTNVFAAQCYTPREAEAEQGIRIHSELMVIGLNCAHMADANGNNLYLEHKRFTNKHADLFAKYEEIMMNYMRSNGVKNPEKALHKLRTEFANKISNDAAQMRPDIFCRSYSDRIERATKMDREMLRKWASMKFPNHPVSHEICSN